MRYCPHCHSDLRDGKIPKSIRHLYGGKKHYSRLIAISSLVSDRTTRFECPDCKFSWPADLTFKKG